MPDNPDAHEPEWPVPLHYFTEAPASFDFSSNNQSIPFSNFGIHPLTPSPQHWIPNHDLQDILQDILLYQPLAPVLPSSSQLPEQTAPNDAIPGPAPESVGRIELPQPGVMVAKRKRCADYEEISRSQKRPRLHVRAKPKVTCEFPGCDSSFTKRSDMERHCRETHAKDDTAKYICRCSRSAARKSNYRRHLATCSTEPPDTVYHCACGRANKSKGAHESHLNQKEECGMTKTRGRRPNTRERIDPSFQPRSSGS